MGELTIPYCSLSFLLYFNATIIMEEIQLFKFFAIRYYEGQLAHFAEDDIELVEEPNVNVTEAAEKVVF